jgi:putative ABC transport system substrate-binding protein
LENFRKNKRLGFALFALGLILIGQGVPAKARADALRVAVLYPDIREPYKSVFIDVLNGIREGLDAPPKEFLLDAKDDIPALQQQLAQEQINAVIVLGRKGLMIGENLADSLPIVAGAVLIPPGLKNRQVGGITLTPDPEILLHHLRHMAPDVKRISVVFNPENSSWLMELAQKKASEAGIAFNALPAENLKTAAVLYRELITKGTAKSDAIWLLRDASVLDERAIIPMILSEAWNKQLVVISNNPSHVRKGALFSLYPDNIGLGRSLAAMVKARSQTTTSNAQIQPLQDLLIAVNLRTAGHLGLRFSNQDKRAFSMLFPSR